MLKSLTALVRSTSVLALILTSCLLYGLISWLIAVIAYSLFGIPGLVIAVIGLFAGMLALTERFLY